MITIHLHLFFDLIISNIIKRPNMRKARIKNQHADIKILHLRQNDIPILFHRSQLPKICDDAESFERTVTISAFFPNFFEFFVDFIFGS